MVEARKSLPAGLSFDLRDLFLAQVWAACRAFRMVIELDYRADDGDEYEELLVLYRPSSAFRWCIAWRSASEIVVQHTNGQMQRFATLAEALEDLSPAGDPQQQGAMRTRGSTLQVAQNLSGLTRGVGGRMSSSTDINEIYYLVVRRGAVGPRPFVWEIRHNQAKFVFRGSQQPFANMEEAHRSGHSALERLGRTSAVR